MAKNIFAVTKLVLVAVLILIGCVKKDSVRYITLPAKPIQQVELLSGPPDRPFKVVGQIFVNGPPTASWQSIAEGAREEAADMGADAVFLGNADEYGAGSMLMPHQSTTTTAGRISGSSFSSRSNTTAGPAVAVPIRRKGLTAIAIVYQK